MSIKVKCGNCGKKLKAKDDAAGKKVKCPDCGKVMLIPEPVMDAVEEDFDAYDDGGFDDPYGDDAYGNDSYGDDPFSGGDMGSYGAEISKPAGDKKPCPMCGEMIRAAAAKCRFCGEVFDARLKKKKSKGSGDDSDMTAGDWIIAVLCSGIGCIAGIVWSIQGKKKGPKMIGVSLGFAVLWNVIQILLELAANG